MRVPGSQLAPASVALIRALQSFSALEHEPGRRIPFLNEHLYPPPVRTMHMSSRPVSHPAFVHLLTRSQESYEPAFCGDRAYPFDPVCRGEPARTGMCP